MRHQERIGQVVIWSWAFSALALLAACSGPAGGGAEPRYPEKKRPEPLRSASDGEVMGANRQSPEDTLEGSPTNEHPAPGWAVEDGKLVPHREKKGEPPSSAAAAGGAASVEAPAAETEDCAKAPDAKSEAAPAATSGKKKRPCPPAEQR